MDEKVVNGLAGRFANIEAAAQQLHEATPDKESYNKVGCIAMACQKVLEDLTKTPAIINNTLADAYAIAEEVAYLCYDVDVAWEFDGDNHAAYNTVYTILLMAWDELTPLLTAEEIRKLDNLY